MLSKITLALALVISAFSFTVVAASAGPDDNAQIRSSTSDHTSNSGGAGGNLVPRW